MKVGFAVLLVMTAATGSAVPQSGGIQRIAWLQGCWELVSPERTVEEQWMAPRGKSMVGVSRTVRADSLVGFELVVIREQGDRLAYEAHPSGQPSARSVGEAPQAVVNPVMAKNTNIVTSFLISCLLWIEVGSRHGKSKPPPTQESS